MKTYSTTVSYYLSTMAVSRDVLLKLTFLVSAILAFAVNVSCKKREGVVIKGTTLGSDFSRKAASNYKTYSMVNEKITAFSFR